LEKYRAYVELRMDGRQVADNLLSVVAFVVHDLGNGREEILTSSGRICHIVRHEDGTWTVDEDERHRVFPEHGDALDCARELAGDPDLPPLSQM